MKPLIQILLSLFVFSACSMGLEDKSVENSELKRQRERLNKLGDQIKGVYQGDLQHIDGNSYPVELRLYYINELAGKDENGDIYTLPRLKGQIRYLDFVYPNEERQFDVRFDETGSFQMIFSPNQQQAGSVPAESIIGQWKSAVVTATWTELGTIGSFSVKRVSSVVGNIEETERRERLRKQFADVIGFYQGELYRFSDLSNLFGVLKITLDYDDSLGQTGLIARFQMDNDVLFYEFQRVPLNWDPRTKIFDFDFVSGKSRLTGSGYLDDNRFVIEKLRLAAEPFVYRALVD